MDGGWVNTFAALGVLAALALTLGAVHRWRHGARRHALLMLGAAIVAAANVAILLMPLPA